MITIDPNDVLTRTPTFIILKNGDSIKNDGTVLEQASICSKCGAVRREHMTFHEGLCNKCLVQTITIPPTVFPERDTCRFEGSNFLLSGWFERHIADDGRGFLGLNLQNGRELIYVNVPYEIWEELSKAKSAGQFYNQKIKGQFLQQLDAEDRYSATTPVRL